MVDLAHLTEVLEAAVRDSAPEQLPQLLGALEAAKASDWARLAAPPRQTPAEMSAATASMTAVELARIYNVPTSWFYEAARLGRLPHTRLGHYVRFNRADVERVLSDAKSTGLGTRKKHRPNGGAPPSATAALPSDSAGNGAANG